jgi:hypothetical protein
LFVFDHVIGRARRYDDLSCTRVTFLPVVFHKVFGGEYKVEDVIISSDLWSVHTHTHVHIGAAAADALSHYRRIRLNLAVKLRCYSE